MDYYKDLRWNNLTTKKYRHLLLVLYWPVYGLMFLFLERILPMLVNVEYHEIYCTLDQYIPFCEWFTIPYYYWFIFLIGFGAYWLLYDPPMFGDWMWNVILMYSATVVIYLVYPNMQALRPTEFPRDNLLVDVVKYLYDFDTNTNVCPSIHVLGSFTVCFTGLHSKQFKGFWWKFFFIVSTVLISISTVFLKQHSLWDLIFAVVVGALDYIVLYFIVPAVKRKYQKEINE